MIVQNSPNSVGSGSPMLIKEGIEIWFAALSDDAASIFRRLQMDFRNVRMFKSSVDAAEAINR